MNDKLTVFIVDDDWVFLEMLKDYLSELKEFKIVPFQNGEDALNNLHLNPQLVIMDYYLNNHSNTARNGLEIMKDIKATNKNIRTIILSAKNDLEAIYQLNRENINEFIIKDQEAFTKIQQIILHYAHSTNV